MLNRHLETVHKYSLLKVLLFFHGMVSAAVVAYYYLQAETVLWHSILHVPFIKDAEGKWLYQTVARGPSLLLPWNLLPQDVFWLGLDILIFGSLAIWWTCRIMGDELRYQVAGCEKAAADKLLEAEEKSAAADRRMQEAEEREQRLEVLESRAAAREAAAANREQKAQAHVEGKDAEMNKMSVALTRLKKENRDLQGEVRRLRGGS